MITFMEVCVVITVAIIRGLFAVKIFWALWDNTVTAVMVMLNYNATQLL